MAQVTRSPKVYDVCIIGSGAAGSVMAKELCEGGAKVILLEAGREVPLTKFLSHKWPYELPYRGFRGEKQAPFYQGRVSTSIRYEDCDHVSVDRIRVVGGRTVHWNAVVLRYAARDFQESSVNGSEEDWPLTYEELEPYYERVEQMIGVCGGTDDSDVLPGSKYLQPPPRPRCGETRHRTGSWRTSTSAAARKEPSRSCACGRQRRCRGSVSTRTARAS